MEKIKQMFLDYSGKYPGKLSDKRDIKMTEKISTNATVEKRSHQRNYQSLKGKHNGKITIRTCAKIWVRITVDTHKNHENSFAPKSRLPHVR